MTLQAVLASDSANDTGTPALLLNEPTAWQAADEAQSTAPSAGSVPPAGGGDASLDQAVPLKCSIHTTPAAEAFVYPPTASQADADAQDMPCKEGSVAPAGAATAWSDHAVPFHLAAKVTSALELLRKSPTASQVVAAAHESPSRSGFDAPAGGEMDCSFQPVPFHDSARRCWSKEASRYD